VASGGRDIATPLSDTSSTIVPDTTSTPVATHAASTAVMLG
jgi:hypothetical protein